MSEHTTNPRLLQDAWGEQVEGACREFFHPLLAVLDQHLDRRLVRTLWGLVFALVCHRNRHHGLLLSELGGYLLSPAKAPAGTKRLSRLLHSPRWHSALLLEFLWQRTERHVAQLMAEHETPLIVWDESVLEKPESLKAEGLSPVRSTKAARLKRIKPGFYNPPGGRPIFVPGFHWMAVLVMGLHGVPQLATLRWWMTRGPQASTRWSEAWNLLAELHRRWGDRVLHVWDQGYAGRPWLTLALGYRVRFVLRWKKRYPLQDGQGQLRPAWQITRGQRSWEHRLVRDAPRRRERRTGILAVPVSAPGLNTPLWLVVSRPGAGRTPWYLLTTEPISSAEDAWRIVWCYARRWQVEMSIRLQKCELGAESPRVWAWETRAKLLGILALLYAFLLTLLDPRLHRLVRTLLRRWCHRTGKRSRDASAPLYRLRSALARMWLAYPPPILEFLNSG